VDQTAVTAGSAEPERILIYDFVTGNYLADFELSGTGITSNLNHLGRLQVDSSGNRKYRIRLTTHIRRILEDDLDNNRLALVVSQNVSLLGFSKVKAQTQPLSIRAIPISAAISHEGTVLHGNLSSDPTKRLKLKIFYTETN
jgi:ABC-type lipoprotein export system ATPase subunit